eukprot:scaffold376_cov354-Prasinococcus_capsulatus_cf.AAC.6
MHLDRHWGQWPLCPCLTARLSRRSRPGNSPARWPFFQCYHVFYIAIDHGTKRAPAADQHPQASSRRNASGKSKLEV